MIPTPATHEGSKFATRAASSASAVSSPILASRTRFSCAMTRSTTFIQSPATMRHFHDRRSSPRLRRTPCRYCCTLTALQKWNGHSVVPPHPTPVVFHRLGTSSPRGNTGGIDGSSIISARSTTSAMRKGGSSLPPPERTLFIGKKKCFTLVPPTLHTVPLLVIGLRTAYAASQVHGAASPRGSSRTCGKSPPATPP